MSGNDEDILLGDDEALLRHQCERSTGQRCFSSDGLSFFEEECAKIDPELLRRKLVNRNAPY